MSGFNALDTKRMDRNMEKGESIEDGMCTQRMRVGAREKERERESKKKEQERDITHAQTYRDACSIRQMDKS